MRPSNYLMAAHTDTLPPYATQPTLDGWEEVYASTPERDVPFQTLSAEPIRPLYTEADLPEGVTAIGAYMVPAGLQTGAVFTDLAPGSYLLATDTGLSVPFTVTEPADLDVPDLFASPTT